MFVSNRFTDAIAKQFYDKTFTIRNRAHGTDAEGGAVTLVSGGTDHKGNVQYSLNAQAIEQYGITEQIDIAITTGTAVTVAKDDEIEHDGIKYVVNAVRPRDSHTLIVGRKR